MARPKDPRTLQVPCPSPEHWHVDDGVPPMRYVRTFADPLLRTYVALLICPACGHVKYVNGLEKLVRRGNRVW